MFAIGIGALIWRWLRRHETRHVELVRHRWGHRHSHHLGIRDKGTKRARRRRAAGTSRSTSVFEHPGILVVHPVCHLWRPLVGEMERVLHKSVVGRKGDEIGVYEGIRENSTQVLPHAVDVVFRMPNVTLSTRQSG